MDPRGKQLAALVASPGLGYFIYLEDPRSKKVSGGIGRSARKNLGSRIVDQDL